MRSKAAAALIAIIALCPTAARTDPIVTGCQVRIHARVPNPQSITFAPGGVIFAGHDSHMGDSHADSVWRIGPGGSPVAHHGDGAFYDPDGVLFDSSGLATGVAGGVLVSDWVQSSSSSALRLIHPDHSVTTWASPGQAIKNPTYMVMDANGAVWMTDDYRYQTGLLKVVDGAAQVVAPGPPCGFSGIAISPAGTIYACASADGVNKTIREYDLSGNLLQANYSTSTAYDMITFGRGGAFGTDLYAMSYSGALYRLGPAGSPIQIGSGFASPSDVKFGPDGDMYVAEDVSGLILRITSMPTSVPSDPGVSARAAVSVSVAPSPFRGPAGIRVTVAASQPAIGVRILDSSGRLVRILHSGPLALGEHVIAWDGSDAVGRPVPSGIYLVRVQGSGTQAASRVVRIR
jgi:sugar lactone lactonase YvrE